MAANSGFVDMEYHKSEGDGSSFVSKVPTVYDGFSRRVPIIGWVY
jgi:hypothetical protein